MIIGTTALKHIMSEMAVVECFNVTKSMPVLRTPKEIGTVLGKFKTSEADAS